MNSHTSLACRHFSSPQKLKIFGDPNDSRWIFSKSRRNISPTDGHGNERDDELLLPLVVKSKLSKLKTREMELTTMATILRPNQYPLGATQGMNWPRTSTDGHEWYGWASIYACMRARFIYKVYSFGTPRAHHLRQTQEIEPLHPRSKQEIPIHFNRQNKKDRTPLFYPTFPHFSNKYDK